MSMNTETGSRLMSNESSNCELINTAIYTPFMKKVLKSFQQLADKSLHGPDHYQWMDDVETKAESTLSRTNCSSISSHSSMSSESILLESSFSMSDKQPIPPPFLMPADQCQYWQLSDTFLEGELISCFIIGGERRLCLPQILNTILREFLLPEINSVFDELNINCSQCTLPQLHLLEMSGILPPIAPSCGLITKSDAERLCAVLLHGSNISPIVDFKLIKDEHVLNVQHRCLGKCKGIYYASLHVQHNSQCIQCSQCYVFLSPMKFINHTHTSIEQRTCHWGFDSNNWRSYIHLDKQFELSQTVRYQFAKDSLSALKARFTGISASDEDLQLKSTGNEVETSDLKDIKLKEEPISGGSSPLHHSQECRKSKVSSMGSFKMLSTQFEIGPIVRFNSQ